MLLNKQAYYKVLRTLGIKDNAFVLFYAIADGKSYSQKGICDEWSIPRTTLNTIVQKYIEKEYIHLVSTGHKEKEIVSLKILSNFSFEEISKLLKEPIGTVKWRYYKSIYSLKAILGNFAMFIVTFIIGIKTLTSDKNDENITKQENTKLNTQVQDDLTNSTILDDTEFQDKSEEYNNEELQEESIKQDINTSNTTTNIIQNANTITSTNPIENTNTTTQENPIYENQLYNNYNQYIGYSFLGISIIFLLIFLYFFIKYQLKHLRKLSK